MKKVFLLSLGLILGFGASAQVTMKSDIRKAEANGKMVAVGAEQTTAATAASTYAPQTARGIVWDGSDEIAYQETIFTYYDLQSNQFVANRMYQMPNGNVAVSTTMSHEANQTASDRGSGYNFYDGEDWADMPEERVEPYKTGWPTIAQWGETGEILLSHGNGHLQCFTREVAGAGEWQEMGPLPDCPEGYPYAGASDAYSTWARVVTCGDNHNVIIAVAAIQHTVSSDETAVHSVFFRSEDAINWEISYGPLADLGLGYEAGTFSADDYALAANGHNVAILYSGCLTNSTWMFKSADDGQTWEATRIWQDPYEGADLDDPTFFYEDTLYRPMNGAIAIDNQGVAHVALNTFEMIRTEENDPGYYSYFYGRAVDGILYWNDTQEAPIQSEDGNPHHAARLWWPDEENPGYVRMHADSTKWIGYIPMYEGIDWNNDNFYHASSEYVSKCYGASAHPALSIDPEGNIACAFSTPATYRNDGTYYYRGIYTSYRNANEGYWHQVEQDLMEDYMFNYTEAIFTNSVTNTVTPGEHWFSFQGDDIIGLYWGSNATQTNASDNIIYVVKVQNPTYDAIEENNAVDVVYNIYPNPATDYVVVESSMNADATITFINLAGQTVKSFNRSLTVGANSISIDLESGVYFCTVNANGFNKTTKVVVK